MSSLVELSQYEKAMKQVRLSAKEGGISAATTLVHIGARLIEREAWREAIGTLKQARGLGSAVGDELVAGISYNLALAYYGAREYESAVKIFDRLRRHAPSARFKSSAAYYSALCALEAGDDSRADELFELSLELATDPVIRGAAIFNRAHAQSQFGKKDQAICAYQALADGEGFEVDLRGTACLNLASIYIEIAENQRNVSKLDVAIKVLERGLEIVDISGEVRSKLRVNLGALYWERGCLDGTVTVTLAVLQDPGAPSEADDRARCLLAKALYRRREFRRGLDMLLEKDLRNVGAALVQRYRMLQSEGFLGERDFQSAKAESTAVALSPAASKELRSEAFATRGWCEYKLGSSAQLVESSRQALLLDPSNEVARLNFAFGLLAGGGEADAVKEYQTGLAGCHSVALIESGQEDLKDLNGIVDERVIDSIKVLFQLRLAELRE